MNFIPYDEQLDIARELEVHHTIFERIWSRGRIMYSDQIDTACVTFDTIGNHLNFEMNEDFWKEQSFIQKCFVISHECMHVALNHGYRGISSASKVEAEIINIAQDIVINHGLVNLYGYNRALVDPENIYCWVDTIFPDEIGMSESETFEYYYNKLANSPNLDKILSDYSTVDVHLFNDQQAPSDFNDILESIGETISVDDLNGLLNQNGLNGGLFAGSGNQSEFYQVDMSPVAKKKKWETVIQNYVKSKMKKTEKEHDQWVFTNRRFTMFGGDLMIPTEHEFEHVNKEKDMIDMWFFLDTSGSCRGLKDRFFKAARSVPTVRFNIRAFTFHTSVDEFNLETGRNFRLGGGTFFHIIENKITKIMNSENVKYPDAVFIVTDGMGTNVNPKFPERWYWFLTGNYTDCIPKKSKIFKLSNYA